MKLKAQVTEARRKAQAAATKNDDSESNLSVDSEKEGRKAVGLNIALDLQIAQITRPTRNVLLFFAMCINIYDLEAKALSISNRWIKVYDDDSRDYKMLKRKGLELSNL